MKIEEPNTSWQQTEGTVWLSLALETDGLGEKQSRLATVGNQMHCFSHMGKPSLPL